MELYQLAKREGNAKKPIYEIHKWWARRLGTAFRALLIAGTSPSIPGETAKQRGDRLFDQFYQRRDLRGLVVLDPFMGGGTSVVEALKRGARVIGVDVDPVAWFVTKKQIEPFNASRFQRAYEQVAASVERELRALYSTTDPVSRKAGEVINAFWVTRLRCRQCRHLFDAHPHFRLNYDEEKRRQEVFCSACGTIHSLPLRRKRFHCTACDAITVIDAGNVHKGFYSCPHCSDREAILDQTSTHKPLPKRLFALEYTLPGELDPQTGKPKRRLKKATRSDMQVFRRAEQLFEAHQRSLPYPRAAIFKRRRHDLRPLNHGYSKYHQLFNPRQLYCLARLYQSITQIEDTQAKEYLLLAFSDSLAANNQLVGYAFGYRKTTPLFGIHGFHVVQRPVEGNVWGHPHFGRGSFARCVRKLILGKEYARTPFEYAYPPNGLPVKVFAGETVTTEAAHTAKAWRRKERRALLLRRSSINLQPVRDRSVDLILTDPPFYNNLPYSELSDFYYQWLRPWLRRYDRKQPTVAPAGQSLFVRRKTTSEQERYVKGLTEVMHECSRVLKRSGMLAFTFHHKEPAAWYALGSALIEGGFVVTGVCPIRGEGVSGFHSYEGTPKWDAVICCRRGRAVEVQSAKIEQVIARVAKLETKWWTELRTEGIMLSAADRASLAFALSLREAVNAPDSIRLRDVLLRVASLYPQAGTAATIPGVSPEEVDSA